MKQMMGIVFVLCLSPALADDEGWEISLVGDDEPGQRLVVAGVVRDGAGKPLAGVEIYLFHTDQTGRYGNDGSGKPRYNGTLVTDERGRYRFTTLRPAPYPGSGPPAHIHFALKTRDGRQLTTELWFTGDPRLTEEQIARHSTGKVSDRIRPVSETAEGHLAVTRDFVIE